jgi:putative transcriptional regulator
MVKGTPGMIRNRFRILIAEKEHRDGRSIPYTEIQQATGIATSTLSAWASQRVVRYDADTLAALCAYLECTPGDLLEYLPASSTDKSKGKS